MRKMTVEIRKAEEMYWKALKTIPHLPSLFRIGKYLWVKPLSWIIISRKIMLDSSSDTWLIVHFHLIINLQKHITIKGDYYIRMGKTEQAIQRI